MHVNSMQRTTLHWNGCIDCEKVAHMYYGLPEISPIQHRATKTGLFYHPSLCIRSRLEESRRRSKLHTNIDSGNTGYVSILKPVAAPRRQLQSYTRNAGSAQVCIQESSENPKFNSNMTLPKTRKQSIEKRIQSIRDLDVKMHSFCQKERHIQNQKYSVTRGHFAKNYTMNKSKLSMKDFQIIEPLAIGYFGNVSLAKWIKNFNKPCVIKCISKSHALVAGQALHLRNEKAFLLELKHPFIVKGYGTFQDEEHLYFVMEFVSGGELYPVIRRELKSQFEGTMFYLTEIAIALEFLHEHNIVFRDLKPENVMMDEHGHIKLIDLGFAKKIVENRTSSVCGTPGYIAPEQLAKKEYGKEIDIWAFGVMMFELLAGYNPFFDRDPRQYHANINSGKINWPPYMPITAIRFIKKLLVVSPMDRLAFSAFKSHSLFKNWEEIKERKILPPVIPYLSGSFDTRYFSTNSLTASKDRHIEEAKASDIASSDPFKDF